MGTVEVNLGEGRYCIIVIGQITHTTFYDFTILRCYNLLHLLLLSLPK